MTRITRPLDFSYSRYSLYKECPKKYEFRYIQRIPEEPKYYFAFGHAVHSALEFLYRIEEPKFPSLESVLQFFKKEWDATSFQKKGYKSAGKHKEDFEKGLDTIAKYYKKHESNVSVPLAVELRSKQNIDGLALTTIVDRIDYLGRGKIAIVDYKTGKTLVKDPAQLNMYQKAMEENTDLAKLISRKADDFDGRVIVERMTFYQLADLSENNFERTADGEIKEFWSDVLSVGDKIRSAIFPATPGEKQCCYCDYKHLCPAYGNGCSTPENTEIADDAPPASADILTAKIDELGETVKKIASAEKDGERLKKEIILLMKERGELRHFGKKYKAVMREKTTREIKDKPAMLSLLKELELFERTLTPTEKTVLSLIDDAKIDGVKREKLLTLIKPAKTEIIDCEKIED